jgi:sterol desaturase/sphingolipid hydroxylase (fatty acid hydroxylase superfamily)
MERWTQGKLGYYLDFVIAPLLILVALIIASTSVALFAVASLAALGFAAWTYAEYWIHRSVLHRTFRREHWFHHKDPEGYVAVGATFTLFLQGLILLALMGGLGPFGAAAFAGLDLGYLAYIVTHDRIHHAQNKGRWLAGRAAAHDLHHSGAEVNFGVVTSLWDRVYGTHQGDLTAPSVSTK